MQEEDKKDTPQPKKKGYVKKTLKVFAYVILFFVALNLLLYGLLSIPAVQQKVLQFAVAKVSEIVKTEVEIDEVKLSLFNNAHLKGVYIEDQQKDTLLYASNLDVSLSPWKLLKNKLLITDIDLEDFVINVNQETPGSDFNFQFLIDAFSSDTTTVDDSSESSLIIDIQNINVRKGRINYDVLSEPLTPSEFNASHIHITDLDLNIKLPSIDITDFKASLVSLSLKEASGLTVQNLKSEITSNKTTFHLNNTELHLDQSILNIPHAEYDMLTDVFNLQSELSSLAPTDLVPFMSDLKHLKHDISLKTSLSGKLPSIKIDSLLVDYGDKAHLKGDASISDYSDYGNADIILNISSFNIEPNAIVDFSRLGDSTFVAPDMLETLSTIRLEGGLQGKLSNLKLDVEAWTKQGAMHLIADASTDTTFDNFKVKAKFQTQNFNLGSLLEMPELGRLSGDIALDALQDAKHPLEANLKGEVVSVDYNKVNYKNIPFTAYYNSTKMGAWIDANLPEGKVQATMNMTQDQNPTIDFELDIQNLLIDKFYLIEGWENPKLTMYSKGDLKGIDLKNMHANMSIKNLEFSRDTVSYKAESIELHAGESEDMGSYIKLSTPIFDASVTGDYNFMTLGDEFEDLMSDYLPSIFKKQKQIKIGKNKFDVHLMVRNTEEFGKVFDLPVDVIDPLTVNGTINTIDHKLNMIANIPNLQSGDILVKNTVLDIENTDSIVNIKGRGHVDIESGDIGIDLNTTLSSDTVRAKLVFKRDSTEYNVNALFEALAHFEFNDKDELVSSVQFSPTMLDVGLLNLSFMPAKIVNEGPKTSISNFGFMVGKGRMMNKYFGIDGVISDQRTDTLNISFFTAELESLFRAVDVNNVSATVDGDIKLVSILDKPEMYTKNLKLSQITIFDDLLGDLDTKSIWSEEEGAIKFISTLSKEGVEKKSTIMGLVFPEQDSLNMRIKLDEFSLNWTQPFMADMLNKVWGSISSNLKATGSLTSPDVRGWLSVNDTYVGIDYTNVTYHISDTINITPDKIGFDNLIVEDPSKNKARVNAEVIHHGFNDMRYKLNATLNNFMVLNTESRTDSLFYGRVFASGNVNINGSDDLIEMDMKLRNTKNSKLTVLLPQTSDAEVYKNIVYINTPVEEKKVEVVSDEETILPIKLKMNLTVTPDLLLGVVIDPRTGDHMQVQGSGLIDFSYDMRADAMTTIGNYTLSDGYVKLKLQNLASIQFKIASGSKLVFNGDPMKTSFDINAYKSVKADLTTLDSAFGTDQYNSPRVTVDCNLGISGNVSKMNVTYDISLPTASDDIQQRVKSLVSTEEQKVKQFAYLVVIGSFYPQASDASGNVAQGLLTNVATSAVGTVLNSALGKVIGGDWQVGTNISSDNGTFENLDMTVNVSRKFLDDKLEFNTNLGYRTDHTNSDQFVGDFDVTYALTRAIKLKVFNVTNDTFYKQAPTTQGVGIVYTKEAKTIKQLLRFVRKKRNRTYRGSGETSASPSR